MLSRAGSAPHPTAWSSPRGHTIELSGDTAGVTLRIREGGGREPLLDVRDGSASIVPVSPPISRMIERWLLAIRAKSSPRYADHEGRVRDALAGAAFGAYGEDWMRAYAHPARDGRGPSVVVVRAASSGSPSLRTPPMAHHPLASPALGRLLLERPDAIHVRAVDGAACADDGGCRMLLLDAGGAIAVANDLGPVERMRVEAIALTGDSRLIA